MTDPTADSPSPAGPRRPPRNPRVVVQFDVGTDTSDPEELRTWVDERTDHGFRDLLQDFPGARISRAMLLSSVALKRLEDRARKNHEDYKQPDFSAWFFVDARPGSDFEALAESIRRWPGVETAYAERVSVPSGVVLTGNPMRGEQRYLESAPVGVDAESAWEHPGGGGEHARFVDLEFAWDLDHPDFPAGITEIPPSSPPTTPAPPPTPDDWAHGTRVLGVIAAVDGNDDYGLGIVPHLGDVSVHSPESYGGLVLPGEPALAIANLPSAILEATDKLPDGGVILIEIQIYKDLTILGNAVTQHYPVEKNKLTWKAIVAAVSAGCVVVEAGGNGDDSLGVFIRYDLNENDDDPHAVRMDGVTTKQHYQLRDSGAILVSAAEAGDDLGHDPHEHMPMAWAPRGDRVDCYAWGQNVRTTTTDVYVSGTSVTLTRDVTNNFDGTSSAAAIVAGVALAVQSLTYAHFGARLDPLELRDVLRDPSLGTQPTPPNSTDPTEMIGVMPDLRAIIEDYLRIPAVYMRDHVGDVGDPHNGPVSMSPDIIVRNASVSNPEAEFGALSALADTAPHSDTVAFGVDNYVYVRTLNRGPLPAKNVRVDVNW